MEILAYALEYIQDGFAVFPVASGDKRPLVKWEKCQRDKPDGPQAKTWWEKWPDANIGIVTGKISNIVVLDVDYPEGEKTLKSGDYPTGNTLHSRTGGGGYHYIYKHPGFECKNSSGAIGGVKLKGLDIRGDGGFIVAPPSVHKTGNQYEWVDPEADIEEAPEWLLELLKKQGYGSVDVTVNKVDREDWHGIYTKGERNNKMAQMAGSLLAKMDIADALPMIQAWDKTNCNPPLSEDEVGKVVKSVHKKEEQKRKREEERATRRRGQSTGDVKNSERLMRVMDGNMRFLIERKKWIHWSGKVWEEDSGEGYIYGYAKEVIRVIIDEARDADRKEQSELFKEVAQLSSLSKQESMIKMTSRVRELQVSVNDLDSDPLLLSCGNGTLDLRTGSLKAYNREDLITRLCPIPYDPLAKCSQWEEFMDLVMDSNKTMIDYLQRAVGYSLTGIADEKCFFVLYGFGDNGKTTYIENISYLLGNLAVHTPVTTLVTKNPNQSDGIPNDVARLKGSRLVFTSEIGQTHKLNEERIKAMTGGGGALTARFMRGEWFTFRPEFKIWMDTNHKPSISGTDPAMWNRVHLIPFEVCIPKVTARISRAEVDKMFKKERSGILAWAVRGCMEWQKNGLKPPDLVIQATERYKEESDPLLHFFEDCIDLNEDATTLKKDLLDAYKKHCNDSNNRFPLGEKNFFQTLLQRGFKEGRETKGERRRYLKGLELKLFPGSRTIYNYDEDDNNMPF